MRHAVLLFNPVSERRPHLRAGLIERIAKALRLRDLTVEIVPTHGPGRAAHQAAEAAERGVQVVFACGGDGTVHDIIQGLAFQPHTSLGVVPLGSANALARHMGLSLDPVKAALQQLDFNPALIPLGHVTCNFAVGTRSRYFIVMAGAGPDGALVYKMLAGGKRRIGRAMYYLRAATLFARSPFSEFPVDVTLTDNLPSTRYRAVSAMSVRVGDLGGLFSPLIRGASIEDSYLTISLAGPPARLSLPAWFGMSWTRLHRWNPYIRSLSVESVTCGEGLTHPVNVQVDGEWLGHTPMSVSIVPDALRLLVP